MKSEKRCGKCVERCGKMKITEKQYEELVESRFWDSKEDFHELLENMTGIEARRYTGYSYYDSTGNYLGDSNDVSVRDLVNGAFIEIGE